MNQPIRKLLIIGVIFASTALYAQEHYVERYKVDPEIAAILDERADEIRTKLALVDAGSKKHGVWKFDWLPGYYVKYGIARITGMEKMQEVIDRCKLTHLYVADKRLYHVKGNPTALSDRNYAVVIKAAQAIPHPPAITLEEVQQLCVLMHETGYISMSGPLSSKGPNYIRTEGGRFCLIDTESRYEHENLLKGFMRFLLTHDFSRDLTPDALKHIFWEVQQLLEKQPEKIGLTLKTLKRYLQQQPSAPSWDYEKYARKFFRPLRKRAAK